MGSCCSSSRKLHLNGTPVYYCVSYPPVSEEHESLTSRDGGVANLITSRMLLSHDLNLNMSIPDTFQNPPPPIPYDAVFGQAQSTGDDSKDILVAGVNLDKHCCMNLKEGTCNKTQSSLFSSSLLKPEVELVKSNQSAFLAMDEEDCCPTCLEEYDVENPKIRTKCNHHFHLSCILEWLERSETCPICDQEMMYETL